MAMRLGAWWRWVGRRERNLVGSSDAEQGGHLLPLSLGLWALRARNLHLYKGQWWAFISVGLRAQLEQGSEGNANRRSWDKKVLLMGNHEFLLSPLASLVTVHIRLFRFTLSVKPLTWGMNIFTEVVCVYVCAHVCVFTLVSSDKWKQCKWTNLKHSHCKLSSVSLIHCTNM